MARTLGAKQYTTAELNIIRQNWQDKSDLQLSEMMGYRVQRIQKMRVSVGLRRQRKNYTSKRVIGKIFEMFANGHTIVSISNTVGVGQTSISNLITKHYLTKKQTENTMVIVLQSKNIV